jgi:iron complex transport system substrate-binding protein
MRTRRLYGGRILLAIAFAAAAASSGWSEKKDLSTAGETSEAGGRDIEPCTVLDETDRTVTTVSADGGRVVLDKNPERAVILMNSLLDLWYMAGGSAVGRGEGDTNVPEEASGVTVVGHVANPVLERILSLQPDLVILSETITDQLRLLEPLNENSVQTIVIPYDTYDDFLRITELFIRLNSGGEQERAKVADIRGEVDRIVASVPEVPEPPRVLILFASMGAIMAERSSSHTGAMVRALGGLNIADIPSFGTSDLVPFSIELVVAEDPDVVLVVTMGDLNAIRGMMARSIESNEAWSGVRAVRDGRVHYLPNYYFLYKPNERYPQAFSYLADILYPGEL